MPTWIRITGTFFALLAFLVSGTLIFAPASVMETVDLQAKGAEYLVQMWAARQFAMGVVFAFGAIKGSRQVLTAAFLFFGVMNIADAAIGFGQHDKGLIIGALVMVVVSSGMLYMLNRKSR